MSGALPPHLAAASHSDLAALDVKVGNLEGDVRETNDRLLGLDTKIDKGIASLASEFRSSLAALASQLSERNRTPWAILIAGAAFVVSVLGVIGTQALAPLGADIKLLKEQIVPRDEINARAQANALRLDRIESVTLQIQSRRYDEMQKAIDRLERQLERKS